MSTVARRTRAGLFAALLIASFGAACRSIQTLSATPAFTERVMPLMARYHVPHVAIALVRDGRVVTDTVLSLDGSVGRGARFEAASLSKPVFATIVMMMARAGRIDLDKPLAAYAGWPHLEDPRGDSITAHMVLSHTSGLANGPDNPRQRLAFAPGHGWRYSGEGYRYLQRVVELAAGQPLDALARQLVFGPLGMTHSTFVDSASPDPSWMVGHDREGRPLAVTHFSRASAATTLRTAVGDYGIFVGMMLASAAGSDVLLTQRELGTMLRPTVVVDSSLAISWGLGWAVSDSIGFHWGSNAGFKSFVFVDPDHSLGIVMFTDGDNGLEIAPAVVAAMTGREYSFFHFYMLHPND